jgi:hypothetical protein
MPLSPSSSVKAIEIHRALKVILDINYRFVWLDAYISPERTEWAAAVQFRNDPQRRWYPRLMYFYPKEQKVAVLNRMGEEPLWVEASTVITLGEMKGVPPPSG